MKVAPIVAPNLFALILGQQKEFVVSETITLEMIAIIKEKNMQELNEKELEVKFLKVYKSFKKYFA